MNTVSEKITRKRIWLVSGLVLLAMLLPVWIGPYPPLYDYPNHLLEAQVVAQYSNPTLAYAESYDINPGWYWRSNALSTLLLIVLGKNMPILLAGQLTLSLYLLLFCLGLGLILHQNRAIWPLLLLTPTLAYNFAFTSGWLNFCYGVALGLLALVAFLKWQESLKYRYLVFVGLLMVLVYMAHLLVWALLVVIISAMLALKPFDLKYYGWFFVALYGAIPVLALSRPALALVAMLIIPLIISGRLLLKWLKPSAIFILIGGLSLPILFLGIAKLLEPYYQARMPDLNYSLFEKLTSPFRLFGLPHQYLPPLPWLSFYNLVALILLLCLSLILIWHTLKHKKDLSVAWLTALGLLALLYIFIPSRTSEIWITEPRLLLFMVIVALIKVRIPPAHSIAYRLVVGLCVTIFVLNAVGLLIYSHNFNQQGQVWRQQMSQLYPAQRVLLMRERTPTIIAIPTVAGVFNRHYTGEFFSAVYNLEYGGFASRTFSNGPVRPVSNIPFPFYDYPLFKDTHYIEKKCARLQTTYDAVLFWGQPEPDKVAQLDACFSRTAQWPELSIWHNKVIGCSSDQTPLCRE